MTEEQFLNGYEAMLERHVEDLVTILKAADKKQFEPVIRHAVRDLAGEINSYILGLQKETEHVGEDL